MENEFQGLECRQEAILSLQSGCGGRHWEDSNRIGDSEREKKCTR